MTKMDSILFPGKICECLRCFIIYVLLNIKIWKTFKIEYNSVFVALIIPFRAFRMKNFESSNNHEFQIRCYIHGTYLKFNKRRCY